MYVGLLLERTVKTEKNGIWFLEICSYNDEHIKDVTLEGEGVRDGVTVCDRGGGQEPVTSHLYNF